VLFVKHAISVDGSYTPIGEVPLTSYSWPLADSMNKGMYDVSETQPINNPNHPEMAMQRHPSDTLRGVIVDNYGIASESWVQPTEELVKCCYKPSLFPLDLRIWKSDGVGGTSRKKCARTVSESIQPICALSSVRPTSRIMP